MSASSIANSSNSKGHSAQVMMQLIINGQTIPVVQMAWDFILVASPVNHPPANAELFMRVDDSESRWWVRLPHGMSAESKRVAIAAAE